MLTSTPKEGEDEREKETGKRQSKSENESSRKPKNVPSVTSPLLFPSSFSSSSSLFLYSSLSVPSICPYVSSLFSSTTGFCPPPHPSSPPSHPPPLLYTHSIIWETRLREMSGVGAIIIIISFRYTVSYSPPYRKQTFKS